MEGIYQALEFILLGGIAILGVVWQFYTFGKDLDRTGQPIRVRAALTVSLVALVGIAVHGLIAIGDPRANIDWAMFQDDMVKSLMLFGVFIVKSWLGAIFTTITVLMGVYFFFEYGELRVWSLVYAFFDWFFVHLPHW
ncbi:MAG: hypothetical protein AAF985_26710, partial [Bacteroidota bacterium]